MKAYVYVAESSYNQLSLIDSATYMLIKIYLLVAMSFYDVLIPTRNHFPVHSEWHDEPTSDLVSKTRQNMLSMQGNGSVNMGVTNKCVHTWAWKCADNIQVHCYSPMSANKHLNVYLDSHCTLCTAITTPHHSTHATTNWIVIPSKLHAATAFCIPSSAMWYN